MSYPEYPFFVYKVYDEGREFWIAKSSDLNVCVAEGNTVDEAVAELAMCEQAWIESAKNNGRELPDVAPREITYYGGPMMIALEPSIHQSAAKYARAMGISCEKYIETATQEKNKEIIANTNKRIDLSFTETKSERAIKRDGFFSRVPYPSMR